MQQTINSPVVSEMLHQIKTSQINLVEFIYTRYDPDMDEIEALRYIFKFCQPRLQQIQQLIIYNPKIENLQRFQQGIVKQTTDYLKIQPIIERNGYLINDNLRKLLNVVLNVINMISQILNLHERLPFSKYQQLIAYELQTTSVSLNLGKPMDAPEPNTLDYRSTLAKLIDKFFEFGTNHFSAVKLLHAQFYSIFKQLNTKKQGPVNYKKDIRIFSLYEMTRKEVPIIEPYFSREIFNFSSVQYTDMKILIDIYHLVIDINFTHELRINLNEDQLTALANYIFSLRKYRGDHQNYEVTLLSLFNIPFEKEDIENVGLIDSVINSRLNTTLASSSSMVNNRGVKLQNSFTDFM